MLTRYSINACCLAMLLSACASAPQKPSATAESGQPTAGQPAPGQSGAGQPSPGQPGTGQPAAGQQGQGPGQPGPAEPPSPRATVDFNRAVDFMRSGNTTEAELEFKQMTLAYPRLSAPFVNLGILYRKAGRLDQSEEALKSAVERNDSSAIAWNELGATQRMRGEFPAAAASYEKAIAADSNFAPAYRNLGVVSDLYLGDPERALTALERYKELTGQDRPVTSWIAELRQRTGKPPLKPTAAPGATTPGGAAPAGTAPSGTAPAAPSTSSPGNSAGQPPSDSAGPPGDSGSSGAAPATPATQPAPKGAGG